MATCENVHGCDRQATTSVPMFMGSIKVCEPCRVTMAAETEPAEVFIVTGDYVTVKHLEATGVVKQVLGAGTYRVQWAYLTIVAGVERLVEGVGVIARDQLELV